MFNISFALGSATGPIIGGFLTDRVDFQKACDDLGFIALAYAVIYFLCVMLPLIFCGGAKSSEKIHSEYSDVQIDIDDDPDNIDAQIERMSLLESFHS